MRFESRSTSTHLPRRFLRGESGAVTVDWTVLAASVVGLGLASAAAVRTGVVTLGGDIDGALAGANVAALGQLGLGEYVPLAFSADWVANHIDRTVLRAENDVNGLAGGINGINHTLRQYVSRALLAAQTGDDLEARRNMDLAYTHYVALDRLGVAPPADVPPDIQSLYVQFAGVSSQ